MRNPATTKGRLTFQRGTWVYNMLPMRQQSCHTVLHRTRVKRTCRSLSKSWLLRITDKKRRVVVRQRRGAFEILPVPTWYFTYGQHDASAAVSRLPCAQTARISEFFFLVYYVEFSNQVGTWYQGGARCRYWYWYSLVGLVGLHRFIICIAGTLVGTGSNYRVHI